MDGESNGKVRGQLLDQLFSAFEDLETQSAGLLQFLKGKGLATDEELAPYLQQAADASDVRWRAARLRMDALLAAAIKDAEEEFARKVAERARAHEETTVKEQGEPGESEQKGAKGAHAVTRKADARNEEAPQQAQKAKPEAEVESEGKRVKDKAQMGRATKENGETNTETVAAREGTPVEKGGNDAGEKKTDRKAA